MVRSRARYYLTRVTILSRLDGNSTTLIIREPMRERARPANRNPPFDPRLILNSTTILWIPCREGFAAHYVTRKVSNGRVRISAVISAERRTRCYVAGDKYDILQPSNRKNRGRPMLRRYRGGKIIRHTGDSRHRYRVRRWAVKGRGQLARKNRPQTQW